MHKQDTIHRRDIGGYRVAWLILLEAVTFSSMILIWARLGAWYSIVLLVPFFSIVRLIERYEPQFNYDMETWNIDFDAWLVSDRSTLVPNITDYRTTTQKLRPNIHFKIPRLLQGRALPTIPMHKPRTTRSLRYDNLATKSVV